MEVLLLGSALISLMLLLWGLVQLNERLQRLEANKHLIKTPEAEAPKAPVTRPLPGADDLFQGLDGQALFEAMAGEGEALEFTEDARKRYELITRKHILAMMDEVGQGQYTLSSERTIRTLRGAYQSWLPEPVLSELAALAGQLAQAPSDASIKAQLQAVIEALYARLSFEPPRAFLDTEDDPATASAGGAEAATQSPQTESSVTTDDPTR